MEVVADGEDGGASVGALERANEVRAEWGDVLELVDQHVGEWRRPSAGGDGAGTLRDHVLEIGLAVRGELMLVSREHPREEAREQLRAVPVGPPALLSIRDRLQLLERRGGALVQSKEAHEQRDQHTEARRHEFANQFLHFVLLHYVREGVQEIDQEKLPPLLRLKNNNSLADAIADLGRAEEVGQVFSGFQRFLYSRSEAA